VGQGIGVADECGGDLGIEDALGEASGLEADDSEILAWGVHDEVDFGIADEVPEGMEGSGADGEGVDGGDAVGRGDLNETEGGSIGILGDEFGIECEAAGLSQLIDKSAEGEGIGDAFVPGGCRHGARVLISG
jgi:hypothetical protein